uniref:Uncharacterized protein n=1 Tax=Fundulus heteroclitus TaxID=8078 RepID=A0A3Q2PH23_FUNHE
YNKISEPRPLWLSGPICHLAKTKLRVLPQPNIQESFGKYPTEPMMVTVSSWSVNPFNNLYPHLVHKHCIFFLSCLYFVRVNKPHWIHIFKPLHHFFFFGVKYFHEFLVVLCNKYPIKRNDKPFCYARQIQLHSLMLVVLTSVFI